MVEKKKVSSDMDWILSVNFCINQLISIMLMSFNFCHVLSSDYYFYPGNYHLANTSPCIDYGDLSFTLSTNDLDGNIRIINGSPDLGVYEYNPANPRPINRPTHKNAETGEIIQQGNILLSDLTLTVFPNPSSTGQQTKLFLGENNFYYENPVHIKLYSLDGKLLHNKQYSNGDITLECPQLSAGMYMINAQTQEGKTYNTKLIITK
jgi:hypothetical protein